MHRDAEPIAATNEATSQGVAPITPAQGGAAATPRAGEVPCPSCASAAAFRTNSYVYAIGRIEARFPRLSVEKEFAQATGRTETAGQTDQQTFFSVLSRPENRYLARQLCWVLTIQALETYI